MEWGLCMRLLSSNDVYIQTDGVAAKDHQGDKPPDGAFGVPADFRFGLPPFSCDTGGFCLEGVECICIRHAGRMSREW
jgi:hypothetical protein